MKLDIHAALNQLSRNRPIFHSEADFQHALAWELHQQHPQASIRLEKRVKLTDDEHGYLDLLINNRDDSCAIELKYKTRKLLISNDQQEEFGLKNQSAQDIGRYDFAKDLWRLEQYARLNPTAAAYAILLTNDQSYWLPGKTNTIDSAFRLNEGQIIEGTLSWHANAAAGTVHGRDRPIALCGKYRAAWKDYSNLATKWGNFRYLLIPIAFS